MAKTVVGLIENPTEAQVVMQELVDCGIERSDIGLMASDSGSAKDEGAAGTAEGGDEMAEGALKGAGTGAALGGVAGLLAGAAALAIPGFGPIIAAGPIASALAGAGIGAVAGGGIGALIKQGVPEEDAKYYAEGVRRGGTLVTVRTENEDMADRAVAIMRDHGAVNIDERAQEWRASGWSDSAPSTSSATSQQSSGMQAQESEQVVPVVKEELQVGKREVETGGVRVYSHVIETPVEETIRLREEQVEVERRPVDRPLSQEADTAAFQEQTIELRETAEEPVVAKRGRVVEEVVIGKESTEREETIRDTVRETEVEVERMGAHSRGSSYTGPERRMHAVAYQGVERRMAM